MPDTPPSPSIDLDDNAALLVIDVQEAFDDLAFWGPRGPAPCEPHVEDLLTAWQETSRPVVVVRHDSVHPRSPLHPDAPGNALQPFVRAATADLLVTKDVNSAFYGTPDLHAWLAQHGCRQLVICGIQTNLCCETTARMAGNLGYDVLFAHDATHTYDLTGPDGATLTAAELKRATLTNLHGDGFARIAATADLVEAAARRSGTGPGTQPAYIPGV